MKELLPLAIVAWKKIIGQLLFSLYFDDFFGFVEQIEEIAIIGHHCKRTYYDTSYFI